VVLKVDEFLHAFSIFFTTLQLKNKTFQKNLSPRRENPTQEKTKTNLHFTRA
jgi:hypothetical protein